MKHCPDLTSVLAFNVYCMILQCRIDDIEIDMDEILCQSVLIILLKLYCTSSFKLHIDGKVLKELFGC